MKKTVTKPRPTDSSPRLLVSVVNKELLLKRLVLVPRRLLPLPLSRLPSRPSRFYISLYYLSDTITTHTWNEEKGRFVSIK
jgi:hypothetical protein